MNKTVVLLLFLALVSVSITKLYVMPAKVQHIPYIKYREEFAYNLKNPHIEKYRGRLIDQPVEIVED